MDSTVEMFSSSESFVSKHYFIPVCLFSIQRPFHQLQGLGAVQLTQYRFNCSAVSEVSIFSKVILS